MSAAELVYFDGAHLSHVALFDERKRLERIAAVARADVLRRQRQAVRR